MPSFHVLGLIEFTQPISLNSITEVLKFKEWGEIIMTEQQIKLNGRPVTHDKLLQEASNIEKQTNVLDIIIGLLDAKETSFSQGDMFTAKYFVQSGGLNQVIQALIDMQENLVEISNNICPDEIK